MAPLMVSKTIAPWPWTLLKTQCMYDLCINNFYGPLNQIIGIYGFESLFDTLSYLKQQIRMYS